MIYEYYPIEITSEGGRIFNIRWYNSNPSVNLVSSSFESPCGCYFIAKAQYQRGFASYWGGFSLDNFKIRTIMILSDIHWINFGFVTNPTAIFCRDGGKVIINDSIIKGE